MLRSNSELSGDTITASHIARELTLDARNPASQWAQAALTTFCADWRGQNADPARQTDVRLLWSDATLYLRFVCRYREIFVFRDSEANGRRDHLWDRDVAEAFLQPDSTHPRYYKEFQVSPNGMWIDLAIAPREVLPEGRNDLKSGLSRSVWLDGGQRTWTAEMAIPMIALTPEFDPAAVWRANFYRVEGPREPRFYSAWQPTGTPQPDFHVPAAFGKLVFSK